MRGVSFWAALVLCVMPARPLVAQDPDGYKRAMQGPMLGAVTEDSCLVWARMSWSFPTRVAYAEQPDFSDAQLTEEVTPRRDEDYCVTFRLQNLKPDTQYYYRLMIGGSEDKYRSGKPPLAFTTAPGSAAPAKFRVAFGSCARWQRESSQPVWKVIPAYEPDLFFWLGDNVYADTLDADILAEELTRQREVPHIQNFLATVPQLAIWDDHDFGLNNHDRTNPTKADNLRMWKRYWPNPAFGNDEADGIFFRYQYGGVDFFFLDGRYHRDPNAQADGATKTMLGAEQMAWLKQGLKASQAPFKVLVSGSVWTTGKGAGGDAWSSYRHERDGLFDWIMQERVTGVVLISGDTHTAELNVAPWSERGGYDLYDLVSSPLAQEPDNDWLFRDVEQRIEVPYDLGPNFGVLDFDLTADDPTLSFRIITLESRSAWTPLTLKRSELQPGISSWQQKQSDDAGRWMKMLEAQANTPD